MQGRHPIAFESKTPNCRQWKYLAYKWHKLLAIIHALKKLRHYLYGAMSEVWMDHENLKWFSSK